ncbi:hypothetical protein [Escherichia phage Mt1B1_P10]|uniref:Uncharacterized protein n=1 Tax=Escherichia phage Mt1B1_P10 TaxID=2743960 RepID=A0A7H0XC54_9CAUD|nr:hypothetical protein [Escherichia phage Mt1B1_P10]
MYTRADLGLLLVPSKGGGCRYVIFVVYTQ